MSNSKKIALMSTLVLLLAVVAVFNFVLAGTSGTNVAANGSTQVNYFTSYRSKRTSTRSEEFVQLDSIISAYAADSAEYGEAGAQKQKMVNNMETELVVETMIKALGFTDAVVAIGAESDNVNIFVNSAELTGDNVVQIFAILEEELGIRNGNIIIMPVYAES